MIGEEEKRSDGAPHIVCQQVPARHVMTNLATGRLVHQVIRSYSSKSKHLIDLACRIPCRGKIPIISAVVYFRIHDKHNSGRKTKDLAFQNDSIWTCFENFWTLFLHYGGHKGDEWTLGTGVLPQNQCNWRNPIQQNFKYTAVSGMIYWPGNIYLTVRSQKRKKCTQTLLKTGHNGPKTQS